jgi:hypothetical protein
MGDRDLELPTASRAVKRTPAKRGTTAMTERNYVVGKKPDRVIPEDKIGKLEFAAQGDVNSPPSAPAEEQETSGRISPFWVQCWSCHKYLTRPLSPPSKQAYTCANCGAVNEI